MAPSAVLADEGFENGVKRRDLACRRTDSSPGIPRATQQYEPDNEAIHLSITVIVPRSSLNGPTNFDRGFQ
jgi:hypothetical protein